MKVYGSDICKDCVKAKADLADSHICHEFIDITANTGNLKAFLKLRDSRDEFADVRAGGKIGIPCFVDGDLIWFDELSAHPEEVLLFKCEEGRIFNEDESGKVIAELTYTRSGDTCVIDHTFVDASRRGQGIAAKLMESALVEIDKAGCKALAVCSYAAEYLKKKEEV